MIDQNIFLNLQMQNVEVLIKEFLAYRGFTSCLKSFENECRNDKTKSYRTEKILESIQQAVNTSELQDLRDIWKSLDSFFFSKLEQNYAEAVKKLETGLYKVFLVVAHKNGSHERVNEFFSKMAAEVSESPTISCAATYYSPFEDTFPIRLERLVLLPVLQES